MSDDRAANAMRRSAARDIAPASPLRLASACAALVALTIAVRWRQGQGSIEIRNAGAVEHVDALGDAFVRSSPGLTGSALALGFLLVGAWLAGRLFAAIRLPMVSGYLVFGILVGPQLRRVVPIPLPELILPEHLGYLKIVDGLAIALIALMAGGEIVLPELRKSARRIVALVGVDVPLVLGAMLVALLLARPAIGFLDGVPTGAAIMLCLLIATFCVANSPAIVIAMIRENSENKVTSALGPFAQTSLTVTICKDLCLIVLFTVVLAAAAAVVSGANAGATTTAPASVASLAVGISWHLAGSLAFGAALGVAMQWLASRIGGRIDVFVVACGFFIALVAQSLHLAALLIALAAGIAAANVFPKRSAPLFLAIEHLATPVYCVFFAVAGASIHLQALVDLWPIALTIVGVRLVAIIFAAQVACRVAGVPPPVRTWLWTSLIPQAGVTIALAIEVGRTFDGQPWAATLTSLLLAVVTVHELIGPPLMRLGMARCGELSPSP